MDGPTDSDLQPAQQWPSTRRERAALKLKRIKRAAIAIGVLGLGLFTGLAARASHAAPSTRAGIAPDAQLSRLEQANNGAFFSVGGASVPSLSNSGGQTSSGG